MNDQVLNEIVFNEGLFNSESGENNTVTDVYYSKHRIEVLVLENKVHIR